MENEDKNSKVVTTEKDSKISGNDDKEFDSDGLPPLPPSLTPRKSSSLLSRSVAPPAGMMTYGHIPGPAGMMVKGHTSLRIQRRTQEKK